MDALDEFFRVWSEPEAWCEQCQSLPAMHVVIEDDSHMDGMTITYAYIWDPDAQVQIPVCRACSQHYIDSLGSSNFQYADKKNPRFQSAATKGSRHFAWQRMFIAFAKGLCSWVKSARPRQTSRAARNASTLSRLKG